MRFFAGTIFYMTIKSLYVTEATKILLHKQVKTIGSFLKNDGKRIS